MTHLPHPPCRRALENTFPNALFGCWRSHPRDQLRPGISRDHVLHNWGSRVLSAPAAPWVTWNALGAHGSFVFLFSPLGCPCSSALHKSPRSCCPLVWTGNFPSPQIIYSFLSMQFSSRWKPLCGGHPLSSRQLDLCSPARLGKGWGAGGTRQGFLGLLEEPQISAKLQGIFSRWAPFQSWHVFLYLTGMGDGQREGRNWCYAQPSEADIGPGAWRTLAGMLTATWQPQVSPHLADERPQICQRHSYDEALLQSCLTLCNPMDCSPPFPLFKGFSRWD